MLLLNEIFCGSVRLSPGQACRFELGWFILIGLQDMIKQLGMKRQVVLCVSVCVCAWLEYSLCCTQGMSQTL